MTKSLNRREFIIKTGLTAGVVATASPFLGTPCHAAGIDENKEKYTYKRGFFIGQDNLIDIRNYLLKNGGEIRKWKRNLSLFRILYLFPITFDYFEAEEKIDEINSTGEFGTGDWFIPIKEDWESIFGYYQIARPFLIEPEFWKNGTYHFPYWTSEQYCISNFCTFNEYVVWLDWTRKYDMEVNPENRFTYRNRKETAILYPVCYMTNKELEDLVKSNRSLNEIVNSNKRLKSVFLSQMKK